MASKILHGPEDNTEVATGSLGRIIYDALNLYEKNSVALVELKSNETLTYGNLLQFSVNLANSLQNLGIKKDDVIAISSENSLKYSLPMLAGLYLGAPVHLFNPEYTVYELKRILQLSKPKFVFCSKKSYKNINNIKKELFFIEKIIIFEEISDQDQAIYIDDLIRTEDVRNFEFEENFDPNEHTAVILNSSGTTGFPKGVMLTHNNFRINLVYSRFPSVCAWENEESSIIIAPFFHLYGITILFSALFLKVKLYILDQFRPDVFLQTIQDHKIKKLFLVPSLINFLAKHPIVDKYNVSSVNEIFSTSSPACEEMTKLVVNKFNLKFIRQMYGMTELSAMICLTPMDETQEGSCGKLCPTRQLKIVDVKTQEKMEANQLGEICVKGGVMKGYINEPGTTLEAIDSEGYLHTGDIGYYNEQGFIFIVDRLKDLIKYKSFQVPPVELEDILLQHPSIRDAGVVGKKDERAGELPMAFVVKVPGHDLSEQEIVDYVADHISVQKRLYGGVRFVDEIPRNSLGKVLRKNLREML